MKVFLSWSGPRAKKIAEALKLWLPDVIHALEPWISSDDIEKGARWGLELAKQLDESDFGIVCVTPENREAPWLIFEAGALSKSVNDSRVCVLMFETKHFQLPPALQQFQATESTMDDTFKLIDSINKNLGADARSEEQLKRSHQKFWPDLESKLAAIGSAQTPKPPDTGELLEEMVTLTRSIHERFVRREAPVGAIEPIMEAYLAQVKLLSSALETPVVSAGGKLYIQYEIESRFEIPIGIWLGASYRDTAGTWRYVTAEDEYVPIQAGRHRYSRVLSIAAEVPAGEYKLGTNLWFGKVGDSGKAKQLQNNWIRFQIAPSIK